MKYVEKNILVFFLVAFSTISVTASQTNSLHIIVTDQNGDFIPNKNLRLKNDLKTIKEVKESNDGIIILSSLIAGKYILEVEAKGFKPVSQEIEVKTGRNEITIKLEIAEIVENVDVKRDAQDKALDSQNGAFSNFLSKAELDALPDEPEELEKALKDKYGKDAIIRVDGFTGKMPPKSAISSIRVTRSSFDAEYHQLGSTIIDVISKAGIGKWTGSVSFDFNDDLLNARNPFAIQRFPSQQRKFNAFFWGSIVKNKTSLFATLLGGNSYKQENIFAVTPSGRVNNSIRNFYSSIFPWIKISQNLSRDRSLNASYDGSINTFSNQGVGGFDLPARAFSSKSFSHQLRIAESGYLGKRFLNEIRLQYTNELLKTNPLSDKTAVIVLDAFNDGGAGNKNKSRRQGIWFSDNLLFGAGKIHALKIGGLVEYERRSLTSADNQNGTFTFSSLADFQNNRPSVFTQNLETRKINLSQIQIGAYIQDDIRLRRSFLLSAGLRYEWQNNLKDYSNFSPRLGFTWSPYKTGKMTFRGGAGVYYDWLDTNSLAAVLSRSISQLTETVIINPSYPNPFQSGASQILPQSYQQLSPDLKNPYTFLSSIGAERQLNKKAFLRVLYKYQKVIHQFRSRDINAPFNSVRPNPAFGRIVQIESNGFLAQNSLNVEFNGSIRRNLSFTTDYTLSKTVSDNSGIFGLPSDNYNLRADRSVSNLDQRHRLYTSMFWRIRKGLNLSTNFTAASPLPYTITTGFDNNGDTIFNDRPPGIRRNSERGAWQKQIDMSTSWTMGLVKRRSGKSGTPAMVVISGDEGGDFSTDTTHKYTLKLSARAYNVFNWTNFTNFVGVQTSPFFHQPIAADSSRRIVLGMRFSF